MVASSVGGVWGSATEGEGDVPVRVIRGAEFRDWSATRAQSAPRRFIPAAALASRQLKVGDIVLEVSGGGPTQPVGRTVLIDKNAMNSTPEPLICSNFCRRLVMPPEVDPHFIWYQLQDGYARGKTDEFQRATTNIRNLQVPLYLAATKLVLAPLAEQRRIVASLDEQFRQLDDGVAALERARLHLKQLRAAALEAVLDSDWPQQPLDQLCASVTDGDHQPPPQMRTGIPFLVIGNVRSGRIDFSDCRRVSADYYHNLLPKRRPQMGDVLYTVVGSYGIPVLVEGDEPFCVQRHIAILRPSEKVDASYLRYALASSAARRQADSCATGTAQLTVPLSGLRRLTVGAPPIDVQRWVAAYVDTFQSAIDHVDSQIGVLASRSTLLRSAVFSAAFSGRLVAQDPGDQPASAFLQALGTPHVRATESRAATSHRRRSAHLAGTS